MARRGARTLHAVLWVLGLALFVMFVIPRWWVLTGDIPATAATVGRIATGLPIAAAAVPVALLLRGGLRDESAIPEIALRLRAWSAVLHVVAGVLIVLTAVAEIWLHAPAAGPWLYALYGAAGSLAILAALAFWLSFVAEKPPAPPKPAKVKKKKSRAVTESADEGAVSEDGDAVVATDAQPEPSEPVGSEDSATLRNKRPTGKSRLRTRR
jgi:hypothetical protein